MQSIATWFSNFFCAFFAQIVAFILQKYLDSALKSRMPKPEGEKIRLMYHLTTLHYEHETLPKISSIHVQYIVATAAKNLPDTVSVLMADKVTP